MNSRLSVKVVGMGAAGLRLLGKLAAVGFPGSHFIALDSDIEELQKCQLADRIQIGKMTRRGWGCRGDAAQGAECVRASIDRIAKKIQGADMVLLLAGAGGGIGGGGAAPVAEIAKEQGTLVITIVIQSFDLEMCQDSSNLAIERLSQVSDALICIPNQVVLDSMPKDCSLQECLELSNVRILESLMGFGRLLRIDGIVNIELEDLRGLIMGKHYSGFMVSFEMTGDFNAKVIVDSLMKHPFYDHRLDSSRCTGVVVAMTGGNILDLNQLKEIEESLESNFPRAEKVVGLYHDRSMNSAIGVTLIVFGSSTVVMNLENNQISLEKNRLVGNPDKITTLGARGVQQQLPLVPVSKGCFDKGESNLHDGEDLDVPTFLRRNIILN
tara:strand:+ start:454 stop:1602 length:1149 start_codon:yes stop_codon:yes gene_type:complete